MDCTYCTPKHSCLEHTCLSCGLRNSSPFVHGIDGEPCPRVLTFDECDALGLDGTGRTTEGRRWVVVLEEIF